MLRYLAIFLLLISCTRVETENFADSYTISEAELILSSETENEYGQLWNIKAIGDRLLLYDYGFHMVFISDSDGQPQLSFGSEGQGPGELQSVSGMWVFDEEILLYDSRNAKHLIFSKSGDHTRDAGIKKQNFSVVLEAIGMDQFYVPANGEEGALIRFVDGERDTSRLFGRAVAGQEDISMGGARQAIGKNQVPDFMKNQLALNANDSGLFSFQQATGVLQKYSHNGNLEWEQRLDFPFMEKIFDQFIENNKIMMDRGNIIFLQYADHMEAGRDGVFILLGTPEDEPATIVWFSNDGSETATFIIDFINIPAEKPRAFTISETTGSVYFINPFVGDLYRAEWPL